jgi:hypothetical protein
MCTILFDYVVNNRQHSVDLHFKADFLTALSFYCVRTGFKPFDSTTGNRPVTSFGLLVSEQEKHVAVIIQDHCTHTDTNVVDSTSPFDRHLIRPSCYHG